MIENRDLTLDDYLAMLRRRVKLILFPALLAPLVGFLISYAFTARYTSQSLVLVEGQKVPEGVVQPVPGVSKTSMARPLGLGGAREVETIAVAVGSTVQLPPLKVTCGGFAML